MVPRPDVDKYKTSSTGTRSVRYQEIAGDLRGRIAAGEFAGGRLLPSEAQLAEQFAASRVTVRRALEALHDEGLVDSRQGLGWFVAADPLRQALGRLGTIEAQLADAGIASERHVLDFGFVAAPAPCGRCSACAVCSKCAGATWPTATRSRASTVWCPERLGKGLSLADVERAPFYELLEAELGGATQTIAAAPATKTDADLLGVPEGSPVLMCRRTTRAVSGEPVLYSEHVFPAHRTEFVVDLPVADRSMAPSGLRLVE